jgi:hypothetical protein
LASEQSFCSAFAVAIATADALAPRFKTYSPGIGPHSEDEQVRLAAGSLQFDHAVFERGIPDVSSARQRCDLRISLTEESWFIEFKLFLSLGDNGKLNDQNLNHLLSPYDNDRSLLTDCRKLRLSGFDGRKFVAVIAYEAEQRPFMPACTAFETLARSEGNLGARVEEKFNGLLHPVHSHGCFVMWEVL